MKLIIAILIVLQVNFVSAQETGFEPCESVASIAVLNKDNKPYFARKGSAQSAVKACYETLKEFTSVATTSDIAQLEEEYEGRVRIFSSDVEFAQFVKAEKTSGQVFVIQAPQVDSLIPGKHTQPVFFKANK